MTRATVTICLPVRSCCCCSCGYHSNTSSYYRLLTFHWYHVRMHVIRGFGICSMHSFHLVSLRDVVFFHDCCMLRVCTQYVSHIEPNRPRIPPSPKGLASIRQGRNTMLCSYLINVSPAPASSQSCPQVWKRPATRPTAAIVHQP